MVLASGHQLIHLITEGLHCWQTSFHFLQICLQLLVFISLLYVCISSTTFDSTYKETSLVAQMVKRLLTIRENQVWSLGQEDLLEKEMATHSSVLAWKIPWTEEPGSLQSMGLQIVGHNRATNTFTSIVITGLPRWLSGKESPCQCRRPRLGPWDRKIPWRRKWQPTPVFLPGKSHGQRSLAVYSP